MNERPRWMFVFMSAKKEIDRPRYKHDCETCQFVGGLHRVDGKWYDCYVHEIKAKGNPVTYVARYGNEGSEYLSRTFYDGETVRDIYGLIRSMWQGEDW